MGDWNDTTCLLCGGEDFIPVFSHRRRPEPNLHVQTALAYESLLDSEQTVVSCQMCGLSFRITANQQQNKTPCVCSDELPYFSTIESASHQLTNTGEPRIRCTGVDEIEEINQFRNPPGSFLNVGADPSEILETARLYGWNPAFTKSIDLEVMSDPEVAAAIILPEESYDVLRLEGSLEQAPDPTALLRRAVPLLNKKGLLVISTVDYSDWDFPIFSEGATLWSRELPNWFFTPKSMTLLLQRCGFKVMKISKFNVIYESPNLEFMPDVWLKYPVPMVMAQDRIPPLIAEAQHFRVYATLDERRIVASLNRRELERIPEACLAEV